MNKDKLQAIQSGKKQLEYVRGSYKKGECATICFFSDVEKWNVQDFIWEFNYLKDYVQPSEIKILINSIGGSCVEGISVFSTIINCDIPTTCVIEGIAASMASVIWAAGDKCLMRDYALLMIHNPWAETSGDPDTQKMIEMLTSQLKTIYMKRFCMDEEKVTAIMNGEEGLDGTFFTAAQAVEAGFITQEQVIETPQVCKAVAAKLEGVNNPSAIVSIMQGAIDKNLKLPKAQSIMEKEDTTFNNTNKNMKEEFSVVAALLGLAGDKANENAVSAKIQDLLKAQSNLDVVKAENKTLADKVNALSTELAGSKASVENLTKNLDETKAALEEYKKAEAAARTAAINAMVDEAIQAGKIVKENKETWISMAEANFDLAQQTLDSIPAREDIQASIAGDPQNKKNAEEQMTDEERKVKAAVDAIVGTDFKFKKLD